MGKTTKREKEESRKKIRDEDKEEKRMNKYRQIFYEDDE